MVKCDPFGMVVGDLQLLVGMKFGHELNHQALGFFGDKGTVEKIEVFLQNGRNLLQSTIVSVDLVACNSQP